MTGTESEGSREMKLKKVSNGGKVVRLVGVFIMLLIAQNVFAQEAPPQQTNPKSKSAKKIAEKKEERKKQAERSEEKALKHQMKIQTKETRKRMKKYEKKANKWNKREGEGSFFKRLFKKKKKRKP